MSLEILAPDLGEIPVFPVTKPDRYDWRDGVLIRTPNWLGDIVMTLPAMMQLRRAVPEKCGIFVACPKGLATVFHALPDLVDKVVELRDAHRFPTRAEMSEIRALYAGIGILFNNSFRDALWMKAALIPRLYGAAARNRSWLLTRAFQFPKRQDRVLNRPHHAAKYLSMSMALGAPAWTVRFRNSGFRMNRNALRTRSVKRWNRNTFSPSRPARLTEPPNAGHDAFGGPAAGAGRKKRVVSWYVPQE